MDIKKIITYNLHTIVDVRTHIEYSGGHVIDSINIPLSEIPERLKELKALKMPIIVCCASGMRSEQAQNLLSQNNIECYNGGSWMDINYYKSKNKIKND